MAFGYYQSAAICPFSGAELHQHGVAADILDRFLEYAQDKSICSSTVVQLCGAEDRGADYSIGIVASSAKDPEFVQEAVKTRAKSNCVSQARTEWPPPCAFLLPWRACKKFSTWESHIK